MSLIVFFLKFTGSKNLEDYTKFQRTIKTTSFFPESYAVKSRLRKGTSPSPSYASMAQAYYQLQIQFGTHWLNHNPHTQMADSTYHR